MPEFLALTSALGLSVQTASAAGVDPTGQVFFSFSLQDSPRNNWRPRIGLRLGSNRAPTLDWEKPDFFHTAITLQIEPSGETSLSVAGMDFGFDDGEGLFRRLDPAGATRDAAIAGLDLRLPDRPPLNLIAPASGARAQPASTRAASTRATSTRVGSWTFRPLRAGTSTWSEDQVAVARPALLAMRPVAQPETTDLPKKQASNGWTFRPHEPSPRTEPSRAILQSAAFVTRVPLVVDTVAAHDRPTARQLAARAALPRPLFAPQSQVHAAALQAPPRAGNLLVPPAAQSRWALRPVQPRPDRDRAKLPDHAFRQDMRR